MAGKWIISHVFWVFVVFVVSMGMFNTAQAGGPPQPYYADYVMGKIDLGGSTVIDNLRVTACISGCNVYESERVNIGENGNYKLALHPEDRRLTGRTAIIYLLNDYGRVRANETVAFSGGFKTHHLDLTFSEPLPVSPDLPDLPMVGDELVPLFAKYALVFGIIAIVASLLLSRRNISRRFIP
tara:strand:+ start:252 stop:800 length:549 start_codon:yes stop_codon:yes gene_type:complete